MEKKQEKRSLFVSFDSKQLKIMGFIFVFLYTFSFAIIQNGLMKSYLYDADTLNVMIQESPTLYNLAGVSTVLMMLVGASLPIYALLLVTGFENTRNVWKYLLGLLVLAIVSEVPYDMAMHHSFWFSEDQNPIFSLVFALLMLEGFELVDGVPKGWKFLFQLVIVISAICWTMVCKSAFGFSLVMMSMVYKLLEEKTLVKNLLASLCGLLYVTSPFAIYLLYGYQNKRGNIKNKYSFYILYFAHLVVLACISYIL